MTPQSRRFCSPWLFVLALALGCGETESSGNGDGGSSMGGSAGSGGTGMADGGAGGIGTGGSAGSGTGGSGNGGTATGGTGGIDGTGGSAGEGGSGGTPVVLTCDFETADDLCPPEDECPIVEGWRGSCDSPSFGMLGMQVGATSDAIYLGATTWDWDATRVWRFDAAGSEDIDIPLALDTSPLAFAVAADDTLYVLGDETSAEGGAYPGALTLVKVGAEGSERSTVFDRDDRYVSYYDLALDPDGVPHVWFSSRPPEERSLARLDSAGDWEIEPITHPGDDWGRYSSSDSGKVVMFGLDAVAGTEYRLIVRYDGNDTRLGTSFSSARPRYRPIDPPVPLEASETTLDYAAIIQTEDALRVAWAADDESSEVTLPGSGIPEYQCDRGFFFDSSPPCADPCTETASGLESQTFAAARGTKDIWVAYLILHSDMDIEYAPQDIDGLMVCVGNFTEDRSTSELVVTRIPIASGEPEDVLHLPLGHLGYDVWTHSESDSPPVAIHAFDDRIAVAARTETATHSEFVVLTLQAN